MSTTPDSITSAHAGVDATARRMVDLVVPNPHFAKPATYLLGALYSVRMAARLGFPDRGAGRSADDTADLVTLTEELARGHIRQDSRWLQGYWVNNATHRTASSFERLSKAIVYSERNFQANRAQLDEAFKVRLAAHIDKSGKPRTSLGVLWQAHNKQKHEFHASSSEKVAKVTELVALESLHIVMLLACDNFPGISAAYEASDGKPPSGAGHGQR